MLRPTAINVQPDDGYTLLIMFDNGEFRKFDATPYLDGEWYQELKDLSIFDKVKVNGVTVEWPGGQDICPDDLYFNSTKI